MFDNNRLGELNQVCIYIYIYETVRKKHSLTSPYWCVNCASRAHTSTQQTEPQHNNSTLYSYMSMCGCKLAEAYQIHFSHTRYYIQTYTRNDDDYKHSNSSMFMRTSANIFFLFATSFCIPFQSCMEWDVLPINLLFSLTICAINKIPWLFIVIDSKLIICYLF